MAPFRLSAQHTNGTPTHGGQDTKGKGTGSQFERGAQDVTGFFWV